MSDISKVKLVPISNLFEFENNPNAQDPTTFTNLVKEIETDGFDEALIVVPKSVDDKGNQTYTVVSGNHRLKAARVLCMEELPVVVKEGWSIDEQKFKVVRRNLLKGELDPAKFTKLVDSLDENYTPDELSSLMGFSNQDQFERMYLMEQELEARQAGAMAAKEEAGGRETSAIDGLSIILNRLFSEYGETIPHSFMFFDFGGKIHLMHLMNSHLKRVMEELALKSAKEGLDLNEIISACIVEGSKTIDLDGCIDLTKIVSKRENKEDYDLSASTKK